MEASQIAAGGAPSSVNVTADRAKPPRTPWDLLAPVISAAGTGIGLVGFVVFFGGAILWIQFDAAGLPATEAVALVPKSVLLVTGAHFLVGAVVLALGAVALLWLYNEFVSAQLADRRTERARKLEHALECAQDEVKDARAATTQHEARISAATSSRDSALATAERTPHPTYTKAAEQTSEDLAAAEATLQGSRAALESAQAHVRSRQGQVDRFKRWSERRDPFVQGVALVVPILVLELLMTGFGLPAHDYIWLTLVAACSSALLFGIWTARKKFIWFGVAVFVAVSVFQGVSTYLRTRDSPKVEPMAAITDAPTPVTGYYIAQTGDRIYVGLPSASRTLPARMLALHRDQVKAIVIGRLTPAAGAMKVARELAQDLTKPAVVSGAGTARSATTPARKTR
jgi:F0F1-type ATP synthase membrane subunit b/b'